MIRKGSYRETSFWKVVLNCFLKCFSVAIYIPMVSQYVQIHRFKIASKAHALPKPTNFLLPDRGYQIYRCSQKKMTNKTKRCPSQEVSQTTNNSAVRETANALSLFVLPIPFKYNAKCRESLMPKQNPGAKIKQGVLVPPSK